MDGEGRSAHFSVSSCPQLDSRLVHGGWVRSSLLVPAFVASVAVLAIADGDSGVWTWLDLRQELAVSTARLDALERETNRLRSQIEALEGDAFALEQAIREELELARPGEVVVRFEERPAAGIPRMD